MSQQSQGGAFTALPTMTADLGALTYTSRVSLCCRKQGLELLALSKLYNGPYRKLLT